MAKDVPGRAALPVARIDESACIGCTICIQKCPVDAIVGASQRMHTVISAECIGCRLCIAPCPADCIILVEAPAGQSRPDPAAVRDRHRFRQVRLAREPAERAERLALKARAKLAGLELEAPGAQTEHKRAVIERALARARERQAPATPPRPPRAAPT